MAIRNLFLCAFILFANLLFAQKEKVVLKVRNAAAIRVFELNQASSFEIVNGKFSAAIASENGYVFEINAISVKAFKCKQKLTQEQFKVVLIDNQLNKTYQSNSRSKGSLQINCIANGAYELIFVGDLYNEKQKVTVSANLAGLIAHSKNLKTN